MRAVATVEATLPSGLQIKLREPNGTDERAVAIEMSKEPPAAAAMMVLWALLLRCTVELDGRPLQQSDYTAQSYRDRLSAKDYAKLRDLWFDTFYSMSEEEEERFRNSKSLGSI